MSFVIEAGADLYGTKHNILFTFTHQPNLFEFVRQIEAQFDIKARASRPAGYPDIPFKVETLQIFGDQGCWVDLVRDDQLRSGSQVWAFQPESIWHSDAQGVIPKAEQAAQWAPRPGSPPRLRQATDAGCPPTLVEKMTACFHDIDGQGKGYLLREDIERTFQRADIQFNQDFFQQADLNRSGHVTWDEWQQFAIKNSSVVDALFFRLRDSGSQVSYSAPPPLPYVSRQPGFPGSPAPYNPPPPQTYQRPAGYQSPPQSYQQPSYGGGAPHQHQSYQPPPAASYQPPPPQGKSYEQEVREYMDQTSPERLREGSPSRMPSQEYMSRALAHSGEPGMQQQQPPAHQGGYSQPPAGYQQQGPPPSGYQQQGQPPSGYQQGYGGGYGAAAPAAAPPAYSGGGSYGPGGSPQRQRAQQDYETARQRADAARMQKEAAERDERQAWDRLYKTP